MNHTVKSVLIAIGALFGIGAAALAPRPLLIPDSLRSRIKNLEASAGVYLSDLDRYLIASDDTTKDENPWLFLMDRNGRVDAEPVEIEGLSRIADVESISQEHGLVYIQSSLGLSKDGEDRRERNLLVRAVRSGRRLRATDQVDLREALVSAIRASDHPTLREIRKFVKSDLDVESSMVREGTLYVGLKNPQPRPGVGLILTLGKVDAIFARGSATEVEVYAELDFGRISGEADTLSDMDYREGAFFLTTSKKGKGGRFWRFDPTAGRLTLLREYSNLSPEGVMTGGAGRSLLLFDQGHDDAMFTVEANDR
jgi:hypothetical protein